MAQALQTDGQLRQGSSWGTDNPQSSRNIRRLTPIECERLQAFPDNWTTGLSDTQRYKCLGNAVTVNVIEAIGRQITEAIEK
jgi:DNA (cytosine-5)-methyltransferase 1